MTATASWDAGTVFPFDAVFYQSRVPHVHGAAELLAHYRTTGWRRGFSPSPYFDVTWYRAVHAIDAGTDPLAHFLALPPGRHHDPHPAFNARWYAAHYMAGNAAEQPLAHYLRTGWQNGARPHPLFWTDWYAKQYRPSATPAIDPFYHFMTDGWREGCDPNPLFATEYYCRQLHEAGETLPADPLSHYLHHGHTRFDPHPLFRSDVFRAALEQNPAWRHATPLQIYLTVPGAPNPCPLFDPAFFEAQCAGRPEAEALAALPPLLRYLSLRYHRDIDPHPLFRRASYPAPPDAEPLTHYMAGAWRQHPPVHPLFDATAYAEQNPACRGMDPLEHYLRIGFRQGASPRRPAAPDETPLTLPECRAITPVSRNGQGAELGAELGAASAGGRVGVFMHIYHTDLAHELLTYANNAPADRATLFISTDTLPKAAQLQALCAAAARHPFEIRIAENRGRNIAPFLCLYRDRLAEMAYGVHIHTKKSLHYGRQFDAWRQYLLQELLGTPQRAANMLGLLSQPGIGAAAPDHFPPIRPLLQWGGNFQNIAALLSMAGESITPRHILDFPSGAMLWFRTTALQRLLDLKLQPYHFDPEQGQTDGTLAHAIERSLFYFVEAAGYRWCSTRAVKAASPQAPLWGNRIFPTERDLGPARRYYPECAGALVNPSPQPRPRLNLLAPTIDPAKGYGGISTALDFFARLRAALGNRVDARLLATDSPPGNQFAPPPGYVMAQPGDPDQPRDTIEDISQRGRTPVQMRAGDILVATAWWTARTALHCMDQQAALFGPADRRMIYLIQDYEPGFYPWSSRAALAEATYRQPHRTLAVFNTGQLRAHFAAMGYRLQGPALQPSINAAFASAIRPGTPKEQIVLLYARAQAERNCLPFLDMMIVRALAAAPALWRGWRFVAVGEDFPHTALACNAPLEILGRLSLPDYADIASRAALGVALMVSPHPSYPPLEMAAAGMRVLANAHGDRNPAALHDNITTLAAFEPDSAAAQLVTLAQDFARHPVLGWHGRPRIDWFFDGRSNIGEVVAEVAGSLELTPSYQRL